MTLASTSCLLLTADRVMDGSGKPPLRGGAVLIEGGRISRIGGQSEVQAPEGTRVRRMDYGDATILPGLVDAHTHLLSPGDGTAGDDMAQEPEDLLLLRAAKNARTFLDAGVTTARENGSKNRVAFALRDAIQRGLVSGPRMSTCGRPITMTGGHMWYFGSEADGREAVRTQVRKLIKEGADYIKIVASGGSTRTSNARRASYTAEELLAITEEAHRQGRLTAAHCACRQSVENCLDAGVDMIVHCVFTEANGSYSDGQALIERLAASRTWVNPTLYTLQAAIVEFTARREREGSLAPTLEALLQWYRKELEVRMEAMRRMIRAGVRLSAGSDSPWGWYAPGGFVHEVQLMAAAGLANEAAIVSATSAAAESIGLGDVAGSLLPGRDADVLVVAGDPGRDLAALWRVADVYQAGRRVARDAGGLTKSTE
jgi:imidazolonepropionase-like amidohydrolase